MVEGQAPPIGELARKLGISTSRVRFYEAAGLLPRTERERNGYRVYGPRAVKILTFVLRASELGFSLKELRIFLNPASGEKPTPATFLPLLRVKLSDIDRHMIEVRRRRREVIALMDEAEMQASPTED